MFNIKKQEIMKKMLFLVPVAAIALASCSSDEAVSQSPAQKAQELTLRPAVQGATRSIITDANFTSFHVVANITNATTENPYAFWQEQTNGDAPTSATDAGATSTSLNYDVTKSTAGKWELINSKTWYWSSKNAAASFQGYNATGTITIAPAVADQKDVLVAYNEGTASEFTNGVPMLFRHVLSQIVIKADNKDADVRQIKVGGVRIHNVANSNALTLPTAKTTAEDFKWYDAESATDGYKPWATNPATKASKFVYYQGAAPTGTAAWTGTGITLNATAQEITFDGAVLQLPQSNAAADLTVAEPTGTYFEVLVQVQTAGTDIVADANTNAIFPKINVGETTGQTLANQGFAWVAVPVAIDWKPGFKYTYVLHFSQDGIGKVSPDTTGGEDEPGVEPGTEIVDNPVPLYFTVTIDEWNDADNSPEEKDL